MNEPTYGEFVDRAAIALARAVTEPIEFEGIRDIGLLARAMDVVRQAIWRQAKLADNPLGGGGQSRDPAGPAAELAEALRPTWLPGAMSEWGQRDAPALWGDVARYLGGAADLLATHIGPLGRVLTPDALSLTDPEVGTQLVRDTAEFADTLGAFALHVAQVAISRRWTPGVAEPALACASLWFHRAGPVLVAAQLALSDRSPAGTRPDFLSQIAPAPLLRREPVTDLDGAIHAFDRLRRLSHAQAIGDARSDVAALRGFASLGYTVTGQGLVIYKALLQRQHAIGAHMDRTRLQQLVSTLGEANGCWGRLHSALAEVRDAGGGPSGWRDDVTGIRAQPQITRVHGGFRPAEEILPDRATAEALTTLMAKFATGLERIASDQSVTAGRLFRRGQLNIPTRRLENADVPRRYVRMPAPRFEPIAATYESLVAVCRDNVHRLLDVQSEFARSRIRLTRTAHAVGPLPSADHSLSGAPTILATQGRTL